MKDAKLTVVHSTSGIDKKEVSSEEKQLYNILEKLPTPKKEMNLTKDQKKLWYWFGREFLITKQLMQLDLVHLQNAAISLDARNKMIKQINRLNEADEKNGTAGWVQVFANKTTNVSGYQTMYEKATKQLDDVSSHFGLSIKDRQKLNVKNIDDGQLSLWDKVLDQLKPAQ